MPFRFLRRLLHFKFEQLTFKPSIKLFAALKAKKAFPFHRLKIPTMLRLINLASYNLSLGNVWMSACLVSFLKRRENFQNVGCDF